MATPETHNPAHFHIRVGWWALALFATLGLVLETLHGFKNAWYLEQANETRRLLFTLAHAHGTLLAVVNLVFGGLLRAFPGGAPSAVASRGLVAALALMPAGFFLGGLFLYDGDPGVGVFLVPVGALALIAAAVAAALRRWEAPDPPESAAPREAPRKKTRRKAS